MSDRWSVVETLEGRSFPPGGTPLGGRTCRQFEGNQTDCTCPSGLLEPWNPPHKPRFCQASLALFNSNLSLFFPPSRLAASPRDPHVGVGLFGYQPLCCSFCCLSVALCHPLAASGFCSGPCSSMTSFVPRLPLVSIIAVFSPFSDNTLHSSHTHTLPRSAASSSHHFGTVSLLPLFRVSSVPWPALPLPLSRAGNNSRFSLRSAEKPVHGSSSADAIVHRVTI